MFDRVSSHGATGPLLAKLKDRCGIIAHNVRLEFPGRLKHIGFYAEEKGYLSASRPSFEAALEFGRRRKCIVLAPTLNRITRPERGSLQLTEVEEMRFRERTKGVVLATVLDPKATDEEQITFLRKLGGVGRPSLARKWAWKVFPLLGYRKANGEWEQSIREVAKRTRVSKSSIDRLLCEMVPPELVGGREGVRWKDLPCPARVFDPGYREGVPLIRGMLKVPSRFIQVDAPFFPRICG